MKIQVDDTLFLACLNDLQELIQIPSVKSAPTAHAPFGEPIKKALDYFLEKAKDLGFQTRNLDGYAGIVEMGTGVDELGILVHIDVVPPGEVDSWTYAPFSGHIADGSIWGRGTLDDKGPAIAVLYAMKLLQNLSVSWNKRVRLIIGTDEESTWEDIDYYNKYEKAPTFAFTPDGCFPVTNSEKGIATIRFHKKMDAPSVVSLVKAGEKYNMTPGSATAYLNTNQIDGKKLFERSGPFIQVSTDIDGNAMIKAVGEDGPSSAPVAEKNAIHILIKKLKQILPETDGFWEVIHFYETFLEDTLGSGLGSKVSDEVSGDLTLATCVLEWDGTQATCIANVRYPSTYTLQRLSTKWKETLSATSFNWKIIDHKDPIYIPADSTFIQQLLSIYNDYFDSNELPQSIAGGTYARAFPNTVAFGALIPGKPLNAHEVNEHVELSVIRDWINIYAKAIHRLASTNNGGRQG